MKFTLAQIAAAAGRGGMDGDEVMHDLLTLAEKNGNTPTLREYYIAHAPEHPQPWFKPVMTLKPTVPHYSAAPDRIRRELSAWFHEDLEFDALTASGKEWVRQRNEAQDAAEAWDSEKERQRFIQWPSAWADEQLRLLAARLIG